MGKAKTTKKAEPPPAPPAGRSAASGKPSPDKMVYLLGESEDALNLVEIHRSMFVVENMLSAAECTAIIRFAEQTGFDQLDCPPTRETAARSHGRLSIESPAFAAKLWERVQAVSVVPPEISGRKPVGLASNIRFYRYRPGEYFGAHYDMSNQQVARGAELLCVGALGWRVRRASERFACAWTCVPVSGSGSGYCCGNGNGCVCGCVHDHGRSCGCAG
mmetsp:Transcript_127988/g.292428  ORF Transcript_127988/g.292428 Transcript_127988/m.292428 type:complete len:218 (+) Transcript_127988:21-674(+)